MPEDANNPASWVKQSRITIVTKRQLLRALHRSMEPVALVATVAALALLATATAIPASTRECRVDAHDMDRLLDQAYYSIFVLSLSDRNIGVWLPREDWVRILEAAR